MKKLLIGTQKDDMLSENLDARWNNANRYVRAVEEAPSTWQECIERLGV